MTGVLRRRQSREDRDTRGNPSDNAGAACIMQLQASREMLKIANRLPEEGGSQEGLPLQVGEGAGP